MGETMTEIGFVVVMNWFMPLVISYAYAWWLWLVSKDVKFEGWIFVWGWLPIARYRLISTKSWYARAWQKWYGFAMMGLMIHRDEKGARDDALVEEVIVHELRHCVNQIIMLGMLQWFLYALDHLRLRFFTDKDPYWDNWFERDARKAAERWIAKGRPRKFNFGVRV